jgi:hypothetical protein
MLFNVKTRCGFLSELWSRGVHGVAHSSGVRHGFVLNTRDLEEAASLLASTAVPYTSELLRGSPPFATRIFIIQSPRISVSRVHTSGTMQVKSMLPHDYYGLVLSAGSGTCVHCVKNEVVSVDPATSFLQSPLQDVRVITTPQFDLSFLRFSRHWLSAELDKMLGMNFKAPLVFMPKVRMNTVSGEQLRDLAENLRRLLCSIDAQEIPNSLGLRSIENNIATLLLESQRHNYSKLLNQRLGALAPWHLRSAEEYMRANSHLPLSLGDICFVTGLNARTLQHWSAANASSVQCNFFDRFGWKGCETDCYTRQAKRQSLARQLVGDSCTLVVSRCNMSASLGSGLPKRFDGREVSEIKRNKACLRSCLATKSEQSDEAR